MGQGPKVTLSNAQRFCTNPERYNSHVAQRILAANEAFNAKLWHVFAYLLLSADLELKFKLSFLPFSSSPARKGQRKYQGKANDQVNIVV